jgi:WD40 repeat protein
MNSGRMMPLWCAAIAMFCIPVTPAPAAACAGAGTAPLAPAPPAGDMAHQLAAPEADLAWGYSGDGLPEREPMCSDERSSRIFQFRKAHQPADISGNGKLGISGGQDGTLKLWSLEPLREVRSFALHDAPVTAVSFSEDGKQVLSGGQDGMLKLLDLEAGREARFYAGQAKRIASVALSPDAGLALARDEDGAMTLWDTATGRQLRSFATPKSLRGRLELDGNRAVIRWRQWGSAQRVSAWDLASGREVSFDTPAPPQ